MASWAPASTDGMYSRGMRPPVTLLSNSYSAPSVVASGSSLMITLANWPDPPVCFLWMKVYLSTVLRIVSREGNCGLADVGLDLELPAHAVHQDVQVQLAHAGDDRLTGLLVLLAPERRVLFGELL